MSGPRPDIRCSFEAVTLWNRVTTCGSQSKPSQSHVGNMTRILHLWGAVSIWSLAHWHILYISYTLPPRSRHQLQLHLRSDPGISELHLMPSENSVALNPMVLLIIIPMNGYFIGNINPTFSDKPTSDANVISPTFAKFHTLGRLIQARSFDVHLSRDIRWRGLANRTTVTTSSFGWSTHIYTMM